MPKYDLEYLQSFAIEKHGECLSEKYIHNDTLYKWKCENEHEFEMTWLSVKCRGLWCKLCRKGTGINVLKKFAQEKQGRLISDKFINNGTVYEWECKNNHRFSRKWTIIRGDKTWCMDCVHNETFKEMTELAAERGGKLLSLTYEGVSHPYEWECKNKHRWINTWGNIKWDGNWCRECNNWTLDKMEELAQSRGEKCIQLISGKGSYGRYLWECVNSHRFEVNGSNIIYKSMCAQCNKLSIEEMKSIAESRGGKCLSSEYKNQRTNLEWECAEGHVWLAKPRCVKTNKSWCPDCAVNSKKWSLQDIQKIATDRGGILVSTEYKKLELPLEWNCKEGHKIISRLASVLCSDSWCDACYQMRRCRKALDGTYEFVRRMNGKILTPKIDILKQLETKIMRDCDLELECSKNHKWTTNMYKIKHDEIWCQSCIFKSESACREIIEEIFHHKFVKVRPEWLGKLELDGYCEKLKIAFEYNGLQHYEYIKFFHGPDESALFKQIERDERKKDLCKEKGVDLIIVPYTFTYSDREGMKEFILSELYRLELII